MQLGVYHSTILQELHNRGYGNLYGIDTNKRVYDLPLNTKIRYLYGNPENTHMPNSYFDVLILDGSFSNSNDIINESKRILKSNGILVSGDSITRNGIKTKKEVPKYITILSYTKKFGGIYEYTALLAERLETEYKIKTRIAYNVNEIQSKDVIIECAPGVIQANKMLKDVELLNTAGHRVYVDVHDVTYRKFTRVERMALEEKTTLMYRANELADVDGSTNYTLFPLIAYKSIGFRVPKTDVKDKILLGSFGFVSKEKRIDELINLANTLNVKLKLLFSFGEEGNPKGQEELKVSVLQKTYKNKNIIIKFGSFTDRNKKGHFEQKRELIDELSECSHYIFSLKNNLAPSASMQFVKIFNRPIICLNTFQAKQMQVIRFKSFSSRFSAFSNFLNFVVMETGSAILKGANVDWNDMVRETLDYLTSDPNGKLTTEFLRNCNEVTKTEDGIGYLIEIVKRGSNES